MRRCWSCAGTWAEPSPSWRWSRGGRRARGNCCISRWRLWRRGEKDQPVKLARSERYSVCEGCLHCISCLDRKVAAIRRLIRRDLWWRNMMNACFACLIKCQMFVSRYIFWIVLCLAAVLLSYLLRMYPWSGFKTPIVQLPAAERVTVSVVVVWCFGWLMRLTHMFDWAFVYLSCWNPK